MMLLVGIVLLKMIESGGYASDAEEEEKEVHACLLRLLRPPRRQTAFSENSVKPDFAQEPFHTVAACAQKTYRNRPRIPRAHLSIGLFPSSSKELT